jgi:magnesium chelatase subunit I
VQVTEQDIKQVLGICLNHRLRKDVLDEIDSGIKVLLAWQRVTDPKAAERARVQQQAADKSAAAASADAPKKAGSWSGLPV